MHVSIALFYLLGVLPRSLAFVGMGLDMYNPVCAFACHRSLQYTPLSCSTTQGTSSECRANDRAYLTTLAWCMRDRCAPSSVETWRLEKFWIEEATADPSTPAIWGYTETLKHIETAPDREFKSDEPLNFTATVPDDKWETQRRSMVNSRQEEVFHARYGLILLIVGFATPIILTLLGQLSSATGLMDRLKRIVVYPSAIGRYHIRPLPYLIGNAPTIGQGIYIAMSVVLHVVLSAASIESVQPHAWLGNTRREIMNKVASRSGVLAVALAPLVILFAGRNNVLLWLTNWSRPTYILLHRWLARLFAIHVILHAVLELATELMDGTHAEESKLAYWIWGIVGVLCTSLMMVVSILSVRRLSYEIFLVVHITLAALMLVGAWYHIIMGPHRKPGVEYWMYVSFSVWGLDRALRLWRMAKIGFRRARITDLGHGYVRVDVPGVRWPAMPGRHAYIHFPTLSILRPWENHPFSVIPSSMLSPVRDHSPSDDESEPASPISTANEKDIENNFEKNIEKDIERGASKLVVTPRSASQLGSQATPVQSVGTTAGATFYIRKSNGLTKHLSPTPKSLLALLDGPYPSNQTADLLGSDRLLLLAGGIGITAVLPFLATGHPNMKLYWTLRPVARGVMDDIEPGLEGVKEKDIRVGERMDIRGILRREASDGWKRVGVAVCGPPGLCDDVRAMVVEVSKEMKGTCVFDLEVDAFSW